MALCIDRKNIYFNVKFILLSKSNIRCFFSIFCVRVLPVGVDLLPIYFDKLFVQCNLGKAIQLCILQAFMIFLISEE